MSLRITRGIVSDTTGSDAVAEADVIMTAVALGLACDYMSTHQRPLQFDMDPLDASDPADRTSIAPFHSAVARMDTAIADHLTRTGRAPGGVRAGLAPGYHAGAMIMGVYLLAGQQAPQVDAQAGVLAPPLAPPMLTPKGQALWDQIRSISPSTPQYTGRGAYTGFVDNKNTEGDTDPVGPRSTVRMRAPDSPGALPRWMPPADHPLWAVRQRRGSGSHVPWGMIGGDVATRPASATNTTAAENLADQIEQEMRDRYGMVFEGEPTTSQIATYTHGMIQAIYKAYALGPACEPFEIAVGDLTKKMASCLTCTLFMYAAGYPPSSIHLGRGESWTPLYAPYNPNGPTEPNERGVVRDLNNAWYAKCREWLPLGLEILDDRHIVANHQSSRDAVSAFLQSHADDPTVAGVLVLDAVTIHDSETARINRTLRVLQ